MPNILYGDIWFGDLDPIVGHKQAGERPVLILSIDAFNQSPAGLVVILPITTRLRGIPWHVLVSPPEGGLTCPSAILCEALRSVSQQRLQGRMGVASAATMQAVQDRLRILMNL
ncbi:MAG: type II toxin-antitoxin system PemK/MazF family toxin [Janthinobacterium lividum]